MSHVYVLALTSHDYRPFVVDGRRIEFINIENVFAAVERRSRPPIVSESELRSQHDMVTAIFNRVDELLPARFGAWIDRRELTEIIARQKTVILDALALVRGRVQMTVRLREAAPRQERPTGHRPETGTEYLRARRDAERSIPAEATALKAVVREFVIDERVSGGSERMPVSLYHLIARDNVAAYMSATAPFQSPAVTVSGPWPPFAFAPDPWP